MVQDKSMAFRIVHGAGNVPAAVSRSQVRLEQAIEVTASTMKGWRIASAEEVLALARHNDDIARMLDEGFIIRDVGLSREGPCMLLKNGKRRRLSKKDWNSLSEDERDALLAKFFKLAPEKRVWEYPGSGPVFVKRAVRVYNGSENVVIELTAGETARNEGRVLWVEDKFEDAMRQETAPVALRGTRDATIREKLRT